MQGEHQQECCNYLILYGKISGGGSRSRTRTYDPAINSRLLYQLSYSGSAVGDRILNLGSVVKPLEEDFSHMVLTSHKPKGSKGIAIRH